MQFISIKSVWDNEINFTIPDIQRGLVWNAAQMEVFWDSLFRGIPVGIFTVAKFNNQIILLDGQQRWNAIKSAIDGTNGILWCGILDKNGSINIYNRKYLFRWTTEGHPWGWNFDADEKSAPRLSIDERRHVLVENGLQEEQLFKKPQVGTIKPYPCYKGVKMVKFADLYRNENAPVDFKELKTEYHSLRNRLLEIIEKPLIPILGGCNGIHFTMSSNLEFKEPDAEWLDIFFRRMNSQGTPFTQAELAYSALKSALQKIGIEKSREYFERISANFNNTAEIAQIVLQIAAHQVCLEKIDKTWRANDIKIFFKDNDVDPEKFKESLGEIEKRFIKLEDYREKFNNLDEKIRILPYHLTKLPAEILRMALVIIDKVVDVGVFWGIIFALYFFIKDDRTNGDKNCLANATGKIIDAFDTVSESADEILKECFAECVYEGLLITPADEKVLDEIKLNAICFGKFNSDKELDVLIESRLGKLFYWWHNKSSDFVTLACGKYLQDNFSGIKNLHEDNHPWDYDHCFPKVKSKDQTNKMCWSSGNNVPIACTTNRSKQDCFPDENYPDNKSQDLLYINRCLVGKIEEPAIFNEFALERFCAMYKQIFNAFAWAEFLQEIPQKNIYFKDVANDINCQTDNAGEWYYVMNDMEFPVKSDEDFLRYKWFSLRNSKDASYAIATCDFKTFECAKRKAALTVVMRGVAWNEEYSCGKSKDEAIAYIRKKWNLK